MRLLIAKKCFMYEGVKNMMIKNMMAQEIF